MSNEHSREIFKIKPTQLKVIQHPIMGHALTQLRDKRTQPAEFRRLVVEVSHWLSYEATRDLATQSVTVDTPVEGQVQSPVLSQEVVVVPILRAGNGMVDGVLKTLPHASVGHVGIYKDRFVNSTVEYFFRLPEGAAGKMALLLDPMLATGDTAVAAVSRLKDYGIKKIRMLCLLAAPEGVQKLQGAHPDVEVYTLALERGLSPKGYILPGMGDAGDRLYGTRTS